MKVAAIKTKGAKLQFSNTLIKTYHYYPVISPPTPFPVSNFFFRLLQSIHNHLTGILPCVTEESWIKPKSRLSHDYITTVRETPKKLNLSHSIFWIGLIDLRENDSSSDGVEMAAAAREEPHPSRATSKVYTDKRHTGLGIGFAQLNFNFQIQN